MIKKLTIVLLLFGSIIIPNISMAEKHYSATVTHVVDGDTVDAIVKLGFGVSILARLRILDLDTPEIYHPSQPGERAAGQAATTLACKLLLNRPVTIYTIKSDQKGKYGRYLARIEIDGQDYATIMKKAGFQKRLDYGSQNSE